MLNSIGTEMKENTIFSGRIWRHGFLVIILCLLLRNLVHLKDMLKSDYPHDKFSNIIVGLMLLFNHIAFCYTKTGVASKIMKTVAWGWLVLGSIYIFFIAS